MKKEMQLLCEYEGFYKKKGTRQEKFVRSVLGSRDTDQFIIKPSLHPLLPHLLADLP